MDWRLKIAAQWIVARLPGGWRINQSLQDLRAKDPGPDLRKRILDRARELAWAEARGMCFAGADLYEIGTGRSPIPTLLMSLLGPASLRTVDRRRLLCDHRVAIVIEGIADQAEELSEILGRPASAIFERADHARQGGNASEVLKRLDIDYSAPADATATGLADASLDGIVSFDVLEHLPAATFHALNVEAARVLRPGGRQFHAIGLGDHYASGDPRISSVHFLRFSDRTWNLLAGHHLSYHNRLRVPDFVSAFSRDGFEPEAIGRDVDPVGLKALETLRLDRRFAGMPPEELAVHRALLLMASASHDADASLAAHPHESVA